MGLFDWLLGQFIDIIEWKDDSNNTIVWRYPREDSAIKYGAKLIVRDSQVAIFVDKGKIADVLEAGSYELETDNLPILTDLQHWDHGFESPFKADVYFINTKRFNLKWGTKSPIILRDRDFDIIRLRGYGSYEFRVTDPKRFLKEIVGTDGHFTIEEIEEQLSNLIVSKLAVILGERSLSILDLARNYERFGEFIRDKLQEDFNKYGLTLERVTVENITLPEEVEKAIDKRSSRKAVGDLDEHLKYQGAESLSNSSTTSDIASTMAGVAIGNEIASYFNKEKSNTKDSSPQPPPPPPIKREFYIVKGGESKGPFSISEIEEMLRSSELNQNSYIWKDGLKDWVKIKELLPQLFKKSPPPIPEDG